MPKGENPHRDTYGRWRPYETEADRKAARKRAVEKHKTTEKYKQWWDEYNRSGKKRDYELKKRYNLTPDAYLDLHTAQDDRCFLCHSPEFQLYVDHDHKTGKVRGLLCNNCNVAIGKLEDSPTRLRRAILYLTCSPQELGAA